MLVRNLLLALGALFVLAGLALAVVWLGQLGTASDGPVAEAQAPPSLAVLSTTRELPSGTLLRQTDIVWKDIQPGELLPGNLVRGQIEDAAMLGAVTRRDFADGDALVASDLVAPGDRRFLAAVLKPGKRAASISVDVQQIASGLILPGDRVDVILTQNFSDADPKRKSVGETVLQNLRVVAVGPSLGGEAKPASTETDAPQAESKVPKTITLELSQRDAEKLFVAAQIGALQLSVRPLESTVVASQADMAGPPTWASDVSPALSAPPSNVARAVPPMARSGAEGAGPPPMALSRAEGAGPPPMALPGASGPAASAPPDAMPSPAEPPPPSELYRSTIQSSIRLPLNKRLY